MTIPELFTCPISLELFSDPVTLSTGQTYDRSCILKWFAAGNLTCPVTMQKLHDLSLVPNHTLTHLIHQWLDAKPNNHDYDLNHDFYEFCEVGSSYNLSLISYKKVLESEESSFEQKIQVIEQVRFLLQGLPCKNEGLIQLGFFSILLSLVFGGKFNQEMMELVEKSLDFALKLIPFCCKKDLNLLMEESKFENFKVLFKEASFMVKVRLCNLIQVIFTSLEEEELPLANKIANDSKFIQGLITSLNDNQQSFSFEVSEASLKAILAILSSSEQAYRESLVKEGIVHALVKYIMEVEGKENNLGPKATKALEMVLESETGKQTFITNEVKNGVKAVIKMVFRVSGDDQGSESAVNCLMMLCCESVEVREAAICGGILTQLLLLLQSQCNGRVKTRARMLLKLLRSMWVKDPKHV
ncbi:U-box domain-containing protein 26-like [Silene latifolia]|uniref:U-box domain-containing protein 26-like n=1 Tax=Silene latifolia TaxID=37657 RepID=UPI003D777F1F